MGRYEVLVGKEIKINAVDVPDAQVVHETATAAERLKDANARRLLAFMLLAAILAALAVATLIGWSKNDYAAVDVVWKAAAFPLGCVLTTFFQKGVT